MASERTAWLDEVKADARRITLRRIRDEQEERALREENLVETKTPEAPVETSVTQVVKQKKGK